LFHKDFEEALSFTEIHFEVLRGIIPGLRSGLSAEGRDPQELVHQISQRDGFLRLLIFNRSLKLGGDPATSAGI